MMTPDDRNVLTGAAAKDAIDQMADTQLRVRFINMIEAKRGSPMPPCWICNETKWGAGYFAPVQASTSPVMMALGSGKVYPLLEVNCLNCGNTLLFNVKILGITDEELKTLKFRVPLEEREADRDG